MRAAVPALGRREFLAGAGGVAAVVLTGCGRTSRDAGDARWTYTDDLGRKLTAGRRPRRVFAFTSCAAALWDFGVHCTGVFGPHRTASGGRETAAGNIDLSRVVTVTNGYQPFNPDKLLKLKPELVVTGLAGTRPQDRWMIDDALAAKLEPVVPIASVSEYRLTLPEVIGRYGKLAAALGADLSAPAIRSARKEFDDATAELRAAIAAKPGLRVQVVYGDAGNMYVARPVFYADLAYYRELGMNFVNGLAFAGQGGGAEDYYETLSWEQADKYPADLILTDSRPFSLTQQQMADSYPTWRQLPAVRQGQLGTWLGEPRFSYQLAAAEMRRIAGDVRRSRVGIAGRRS